MFTVKSLEKAFLNNCILSLTIIADIFNAHIPKKLFKSIRKNAVSNKKDEFDKGRLFRRVTKIHISKTSSAIAEMDFVDYGVRRLVLICKILFRDTQRFY